METLQTILTHWFFWGFVLGFFLCVLSLIAHAKTKNEFKRLKGHLGDKLEIEAEKMSEMKAKTEALKTENEHLRMKVNSGRVQDDYQSLERELEIYARAEKAMVVNAPGFAQAWERAKEAALVEVEAEEAGKSLPRRIFKKFFHKSGGHVDEEVVDALPSESTNRKKEPAPTEE
ncbi:MAG: hypothetical protein WD342_05410 [Verrucomicrobiales bacterium]